MKFQEQDRERPTVTFILSTFEIHIEYHSDDENHFHLVLVNGHSQIAFRFPLERDVAVVAKVSSLQGYHILILMSL